MFATLRNKLRWAPIVSSERKYNQKSLFLIMFIKLLEDVLFWRSVWLSVSFIITWNVVFLVCVHREINLLQLLLSLLITASIMDAFETWLKYKHRTTFLKRITQPEPTDIKGVAIKLSQWISRKWYEFVNVRETNHTKAFLLVNIVLGLIFFIAKYMNNYVLVYLVCLFLSVCYKIVPPVLKVTSQILQDMESEAELEGLIPEASDINIKLLSIEPEKNTVVDERQSLDYWKPDDIPIEEGSDSSENSSIITNFSMEKVQSLKNDVETSDSSEDEYIPLDQHQEVRTSVQVVEPSTWSNSAYNAFWNITGAVANIMQTEKEQNNKRKRVSSVDSSDGFEIVDKNDLY